MSNPNASLMRAHLLVYDIPTKAELPNPSNFLWRMGARINLSAWIIPDKNVPLIPVNEWRAKGAVVEFVRFDERDGETILRLAREALANAIGAMRAGIDESMAKTAEKLAAVASNDEQGLKVASRPAYGALYRAKRFAATAQECALTFDLMGDVQSLIDALREDIRANDTLYYGWVDTVKKNLPRTFTTGGSNGTPHS